MPRRITGSEIWPWLDIGRKGPLGLISIAWRRWLSAAKRALPQAVLAVLVLALSARGDEPPAIKSPLAPTESLAHFELAPHLRVELVAAEPEVIDPVSIAFDEDGRLYVVEMRDYPNGPAPGQPPLSTIRLLEDRDHDGRYETSFVFAENLLFPTGALPWNGGLIVTLAGEIAWFKDTDGDHRADVRETWFTGFAQENSQLRANHPTFGPDNRIYVANGLRGGTVVPNEARWGAGRPSVPINGKDFRFNPHTGECEAIAGHGHYGLTFDDEGNRFVCDNRHPCRQVMLEDQYTKRNAFLTLREVVHDVCAPAERSRIFPISRAWTTSNLHAGQFTAACGTLIYRGDALLERYYGSMFVCDPTGNLVHRERRKSTQPSSTAKSIANWYDMASEGDREFLASPDEWFRPVDLTTGPDGALYIVDMYRAVIEHPEWVPQELKNRPDTLLGNDRGRIYRILPRDAEPRRKHPALSRATGAELVELYEHRDGWHRDTAARLLFERKDRSVVGSLEELALTERAVSSAFRLRAASTVEGLDALSTDFLERGVVNPSLAQWALARLAPRLKNQQIPEDSPILRALYSIPRERGREAFQQLLTLGDLPDSPQKRAVLARALLVAPEDEWWRRAVWTSLGDEPEYLLADVLSQMLFGETSGGEQHAAAIRELAEIVGARRDPREISPVLGALLEYRERDRRKVKYPSQFILLAGWNGLGQGLVRRGDTFPAFLKRLEEQEEGVVDGLKPMIAEAASLAVDEQAPLELRLEAVEGLGHVGFEAGGDSLLTLARGSAVQPLRLGAIESLARYRDPRIAPELMDEFATLTPPLRRAVLNLMLRDVERTRQLLARIAAKQMAPTELDPLAVQALVSHGDSGVRDEAKRLLAALIPADRQQVLEAYRPALLIEADARRGKPVFEKHCATCHRIGGVGVDVAPDISDSRTRTGMQLLNDILNPNQAIDNNYMSYTVVTRAGVTHTGVIGAETPASITLRQPEGKTVELLRQDIDELRSNGVSLMPDGLEKQIPPERMADLIAYIKHWRYLDGAVPADTTKPAR
jgi:putative membrane-bound dehydrogenase-like protein